MYAASYTTGIMYAFDAATGKIRIKLFEWRSAIAGASISNGVVFWGSGYAHISGGRGFKSGCAPVCGEAGSAGKLPDSSGL